VDPNGILMTGAKLVEPLDLRFVTVPFPLGFSKSKIDKEMLLNDADLRALSLSGSSTGSITAERLHVRSGLFLSDVFVNGEARFVGAAIDGQLRAEGGKFKDPGKVALNANGANIKGVSSCGTNSPPRARSISSAQRWAASTPPVEYSRTRGNGPSVLAVPR